MSSSGRVRAPVCVWACVCVCVDWTGPHPARAWTIVRLVATIEQDIIASDIGVSFDDIASLEMAKDLLNEAVVLPLIIPEFFTGGCLVVRDPLPTLAVT